MANVDPSMSVVVLEVLSGGELRKFSRPGAARDTDTVRRIWSELAVEIGAAPEQVRRIYAEWEPAPEDQAFVSATFPSVPLTFSFSRPPDGDWESAFRDAEATIRATADQRQAGPRGPSAQAKQGGNARWWQFWR